MVTVQDAKIERLVEVEEIKELRELQEAKKLLDAAFQSCSNAGGYVIKDAVPNLDRVARLLLDAKIRNDKIKGLSERIERDFLSFRKGGSKEKYLTTEEARILTATRNIAMHLKSIFQAVEQAIHFARQPSGPSRRTAYETLQRARSELDNIIIITRQLYVLERQLDVALGR